MPIYVVLKKRKEHGIFLPHFDAYVDKPTKLEERWKLLELETGDCVDVAKFSISDNLGYINVLQYRVSNLDGKLKEEMTEAYTLPRYGQ
jgi:hypothetical protein